MSFTTVRELTKGSQSNSRGRETNESDLEQIADWQTGLKTCSLLKIKPFCEGLPGSFGALFASKHP
jgi:hypothetical protein